MRPPGATEPISFIELCTRCDACLDACPTDVIYRGDGGFPELSFHLDACEGCGECQKACQTGALLPGLTSWPAGKWRLEEQCLPRQGVACQSCADACDQQAIAFVLDRTLPIPSLTEDLCTSCGACVSVCPTNAIAIVANESPQGTDANA